MTPEQFQRVDEIFNAALAVDPAARPQFLAEACNGDAEIRREVEALLAFDAQPKAIFRTPAIAAGMQFTTNGLGGTSNQPPTIPERIGSYRIQRVLGEGGFGVVYLAEQENPRRTVALKVLKPRAASPSALKRFEYEAQILGRLQHPGIAQVYEAGTSLVGECVQAWFAMEYVAGRPLDAYALGRRSDLRERLELLAQVCDAVQYAHQKGVIHRDLKPANILVDEHGRPKVLDFGVARTTDPDRDLTTLQTSIGQIIGTLAYMSPEQVVGDPAEIDTRSDVYTLGVILYQLLSGVLPHDFSSCSIVEATRRIREVEPPRLGVVNRACRGEIETIVTKAMEKQRLRRYQSAADLAADIRRYLAGGVIDAKRDSALYVLRKTLRRYRGLAAGAVLFVATLATFSVLSFLQAQRNRMLADQQSDLRVASDSARDRAERERRRADAIAAERAQALRISNIERGRLLGRTGNFRAAEQVLWDEHLRDPDSAHTFWALWELYAHTPSRATVRAHADNVWAIAHRPDGEWVATSGSDGQIKLWDTQTWTLIAVLRGHRGNVQAVAFSPDGRQLASGGEDRRIVLWNLQVRQVEQVIEGGHLTGVRALRYFPEGDLLLAVDDTSGIVWDTRTGACIANLDMRGLRPSGAAIAAGGPPLAIGTIFGEILLWDQLQDAPTRVLEGHSGNVTGLAFSLDGLTLYSGSGDRSIRQWDLESGQCLAELQANNGTVRALFVTPDGRWLGSMGWWRLDLWDLRTLSRARSLPLHDGVQGNSLSPDGATLVWGASSGEVRAYDVDADTTARRTLGPHESRISAGISPDSGRVVTGDVAGNLRVWNRTEGSLLDQFAAHRNRIRSVHFTADGRRVVTGSNDLMLRVWDAATWRCLLELESHSSANSASIAISPDGRLIAHSLADRSVEVVEIETGARVLRLPPFANQVLGLAFRPGRDELAVSTRDLAVSVWRLDGAWVSNLPGAGSVWTPAYSHDGALLAVGDWGHEIRVWDADSFALLNRLEGHAAAVFDVAFRPGDAALLASASADGMVKLWDALAGRCLVTLDAFDDWDVLAVGFDASGRYLVASGADGMAHAWDLGWFDRHIAGNAEYQLGRAGPNLDGAAAARLRAWLRRVNQDEWPRQPPAGAEAEPVRGQTRSEVAISE